MSKLIQIEQALLALNDASFQRLGDAYLRRLGYDRLNPLGLVLGVNKVAQGTPDSLICREDGTFDFVEHSTQQSGVFAKFKEDIEKCLDEGKTGIPVNLIHEIILCHNSKLSSEKEYLLQDLALASGVKLRTIGLGNIAHDLYQKFPVLAKDFLGIEIDTGQIVGLDDFVTGYDRAAFTTPLDTAFHFRDQEIAQALSSLEIGKVVLISGRPGMGKSRLALECCRRYTAQHPDVHIHCIRNRGLDLFQDIKAHLIDPGAYLILVDDANRISGFGHVLHLLQETSDDRKYAIVATVRDYALDPVVDLTRPYGTAVVELDRLKDEQIQELVRDEFGIKNDLYLERIAGIAQGNPRLAVMAAKVAVDANTLESIANVSSLYDEHYRTIRQDLHGLEDSGLLKAAAIIAFFRVVDRSNDEQMGIILQVFGMPAEEFWNYALRLHEMELVDIYEKEMAKVSDQVLATYLFYLATLRGNIIDLTSAFVSLFPRFRQRFVEALSPIFEAFGAEATGKAIRPHVEAAWDVFLRRGTDDIWHLMDLFWFIRPDETLCSVEEIIQQMPIEPPPEAGLEFKESTKSVPFPSALSILGRFAHDDDRARMKIALQFIEEHCESGYRVANPELVSSDAQEVVPFFLRELMPSEYRHCMVAHQYLDLLERLDVAFDGKLLTHFTNETFELAILLLDDWTKHRTVEWEEFEKQKQEQLNEFGKRLREDDVDPFIQRCKEIRRRLTNGSQEAWTFDNALRQALLAMAEQNPPLFVTTVLEHLWQGNALALTPHMLVSKLIGIAGPDKAYQLLSANEYQGKNHWLSAYFVALPPEVARQTSLDQLLELYTKSPANQLVHNLDFLLKFIAIDPDVVLKITRFVVAKVDAEPEARWLLRDVVNWRTDIGRSVAVLFRKDISLLKQIYLATAGGNLGDEDHDGKVFDVLLLMDKGFIVEWVAWIYGRKEYPTRYDDHRNYAFQRDQ